MTKGVFSEYESSLAGEPINQLFEVVTELEKILSEFHLVRISTIKYMETQNPITIVGSLNIVPNLLIKKSVCIHSNLLFFMFINEVPKGF